MKIQSKILIILGVGWLVLCLLYYFLPKFTLTITEQKLITLSLISVFVLGVWFLFKNFILNRLLNINQQVSNIHSGNEYHKRIQIKGDDEIQNMAISINSLLDIISLSQEQLKYRISLRTKELKELSELNKNLFKEINEHRASIKNLREDEKTLRRLAYFDALTELPNKLLFIELLKQAIKNAENNQSTLAIALINVDKFKMINDTYGHFFGNKVLKLIADQLKESIHSIDVVARYAGDAYILCLSNPGNVKSIQEKIENILATLTQPVMIDMIPIHCAFSVGVSVYPTDGLSINELFQQIDIALSHAKKKPGSSYVFYHEIKKPQIA